MGFKYKIFLIAVLSICFDFVHAQSFVHPGLLNSKADLERMKNGVSQKLEPIYSGYKVFANDLQSKYDYKMLGPLATVSRNPTVGQSAYDSDANAAYQNSIMWCITGDKRYAEKAKEIINAWSGTLKNIAGKDAVLMAGLGPFKMINAAEIIRYTNAGWSSGDIEQAESNFKEVVYPVLKDFAPFANGNWDSAALKTVMAIAIFCNDRSMFERALQYYVNGDGDGALTNYIINDSGQCQESGRDQAHTQLGIAHLGDCCEMAWHQGLDLYGYANNRLLKGFEYTAKFNLGFDVPYTPAMDRTGKYKHAVISSDSRGRLRPVYEQIYNHYVAQMGIPAPHTQEAAEKIRPELKGQPGADHPGFGTLLYSIRPGTQAGGSVNISPAMPGGIVAIGTDSQVKLTWVAVVDAGSYVIERASKLNGPYSIVSSLETRPQFIDRHIKRGKLYYYRITAVNENGHGMASLPVKISAGLPESWTSGRLANAAIDGVCAYDGDTFTLGATGTHVSDVSNKQFQYVFYPMIGDGAITARFTPPVASQFAELGLMIRDNLAREGEAACLVIRPRPTLDAEIPVWKIDFLTNSAESKSPTTVSDQTLAEPSVRWGRMMEPYWLKLARKGTLITGSVSCDGQTWVSLGSAQIAIKRKIFIGMVAASGVEGISTKVKFDHVDISQPN